MGAADRNITRELTSWTQSLVQWNDTGNVLAYYNISSLLPNTMYRIYNNTDNFVNLTTDGDGVLPQFSVALSGEHEIKVEQS